MLEMQAYICARYSPAFLQAAVQEFNRPYYGSRRHLDAMIKVGKVVRNCTV